MHLHFDADPPSGKPALLLVHGLLSSRNHWLPNLARLRQAFRTVRVDLPGHGHSPAPPETAPLHPERLVLALDDIRQRLGLQNWAICGQSFGAGLTLRYALNMPAHVLLHVFTNATVAVSDWSADEVLAGWSDRLLRLKTNAPQALLQERVHPIHARRYPDGLRRQLAEDADAMDALAYARLIEQGLAHLALGQDLTRIDAPGLLVNGLHEKRFQPLRQNLHDRLPDLRIVDLPGGHSINIENPEGFDRAVLDFAAMHLGFSSAAL